MLDFQPQDFDSSFVWVLFVGKSTTILVAETPENTRICMSCLRGCHFGIKTPHHPTASIGMSQDKQPAGQEPRPKSTEDRVPKATLTSQLPINAPCDTTLPACGTRPSFTHQWEGSQSPPPRKSPLSLTTSLTHWKADTRRRGA